MTLTPRLWILVACVTALPHAALAHEEDEGEHGEAEPPHKEKERAKEKHGAKPATKERTREREREREKDDDEERGLDGKDAEREHEEERDNEHGRKDKGKEKDHDKSKHDKPNKAKAAKKPAKDKAATAAAKSKHLPFAVGFDGGWEATYGNALTFTYFPWEDFGLTAAAGYNNSGVKVGVGSEVLLPLHKEFGLRFIGALVESLGKEGEVSLNASFIPANSSTPEPIVATKRYKLTPATLLDLAAGGYYSMTQALRLTGMLGYNIVLSGNEVTFDTKTSYDKQVSVTNGPDFSAKFDEKAKDVVKAGGVGGYVGLQYLF